MNRIAIVTGVPGVGKSTILESVKGIYIWVVLGTEMLPVAKKMFGIDDRDMLRKLSASDLSMLRRETFKTIGSMEGNIILDTHASVRTNLHQGLCRYTPGFTIQELSFLDGLKAFVNVEASPEDILSHRKNDSSRKREIESLDEIQRHIDVNMAFLAAFGTERDVPVYTLFNRNNNIEEAREAAKKMFYDIFR